MPFSANPHWEPALRAHDGRSDAVAEYVAADPRFDDFFTRVHGLIASLLDAFVDEGKILAAQCKRERWQLALMDTETRQVKKLDELNDKGWSFASLQASGSEAVFFMGSPTMETRIVKLNMESGDYASLDTHLASALDDLDKRYFSVPVRIEFPTSNEDSAYAWYYPPVNPDYSAPEGTLK